MQPPPVTIGLPVYNGANYVAEAIESVRAQTYSDFELVISDNASTDATEEICRDFAERDNRIRYCRQEQNCGAAANFNRTFELARGKYFKWLAHDDAIAPHYLTRTVDVLDQEPAAVLCHSKTSIIDRAGELVVDESDETRLWKLQGLSLENERTRLQHVSSPHPHKRYTGVLLYSIRNHELFGVIRRCTMRKTNLHGAYCGGEKVFLAELSLRGAFHEVDEILSFSRWHPERFSSNASARAQQLHMDPKSRPRLPRQVRSTWGYYQAIGGGELSVAQRAGCLLGLARFLMQVKKWKSVISDYTRGVGQLVTLPETMEVNGQPHTDHRHWTMLGSCHKEVVEAGEATEAV